MPILLQLCGFRNRASICLGASKVSYKVSHELFLDDEYRQNSRKQSAIETALVL